MAHGGARPGSGAKPKWKEEQVIDDLTSALKKLYQTKKEREEIQKLIMDVAQTDNGKLWILRRLVGDPKKAVELSNPEDSKFTVNVVYESKPNDPNISKASAGE